MKNIFLASYLPLQAGAYFNRVLIVSQLAQIQTNNVPTVRDELFGQLQNVGRNYVQNIQFANQLYLNKGLPILTLPKFPKDYFDWCAQFIQHLKTTLDLNSPEGWMHSYGYNLGDLNTTCWVLQTILYIRKHTQGAHAYTEQIEHSLKDIQNIKFRSGAPAMLLGNHNATYRFLWEYWRTLDNLIQQLLDYQLTATNPDIDGALQFLNALISKMGEITQEVSERL